MFDIVIGEKSYLDPIVVCVKTPFWGLRAFITRESYETYNKQEGVSVFLYTHIINESMTFYGFSTEVERTFFQLLIKVSGIGPKLAIRALAHLSYKEIYAGILDNDPKLISSLPGIGAKTAQKIILELQDKLSSLPVPLKELKKDSLVFSEAFMALENFGFDSHKIKAAIKELQKETKEWELSMLIRELLLFLNKK